MVAPYIVLSVMFATLNARLHLPPFSLFLVAPTLTDGVHFLNPGILFIDSGHVV